MEAPARESSVNSIIVYQLHGYERIKDRAENKKISSKDEFYYYKGGFGDLAIDIIKYLKILKQLITSQI